MPSSQFSYIPKVIDLILNSPHQSILDVGPGFGKYGVLCREYCDLIPLWFEKRLDGFDRKNWQVRIDAVEPCEKYITDLHRYIYDNIYIDTIEDFISICDSYDLILMIGIIEHLEKNKALKVIKTAKDKFKSILLVTPNGFRPQKAEWDNPLEKHLSGWMIQDFANLDFECLILPQDKIIAYWKK